VHPIGSGNSKSQTKSQRSPAPSAIRPRPASITAGRRHIRRRPAPSRDRGCAPYKRAGRCLFSVAASRSWQVRESQTRNEKARVRASPLWRTREGLPQEFETLRLRWARRWMRCASRSRVSQAASIGTWPSQGPSGRMDGCSPPASLRFGGTAIRTRRSTGRLLAGGGGSGLSRS